MKKENKMDKQVKVVLGANYGDECKGLVSFCLAKEANAQGRKVLTVLFNGGAQRAHTADGKIFHCTGTGLSVGSDTYYHPRYLVDPIALWLEQAYVNIDPDCRVVLPCDVVNNQAKELAAQKNNRHDGSCGMGIFECVKRSTIRRYCVKAYQIFVSWTPMYDQLIDIEKKFGYPRDSLYNNENFMRACEWVRKNCRVMTFEEVIRGGEYDTVIFEGGQGLMLDQGNRDDFPHLTPSNTGLHNIASNISQMSVTPEVYYVSRSYLTRHGKGPLPKECKREDICANIVDETNKPNPWQGEIRYGYLDTGELYKRIKKSVDEYRLAYGDKIDVNLVYSHLNYTDGKLAVGRNTRGKIFKPSFVKHVYGSNRKDDMGVIL